MKWMKKWKPLHVCFDLIFALCYNILISKENFCGTCILNQNFILRDIMTQLVKVTNVWKIEGYQELYTFIINWQPLKFQYESPKKSAKWVLSKISIPVINIYVCMHTCAFCMIADGTVDVWSNHCLFTKQFSDTIMAKVNQSQYTRIHDGSIPIFCHCRIHYNILQ